MKISFFLLPCILTTPFLFAQYKPIDQGSSVTFTVKNFGFNVVGTFSGLQGTINFDPGQPAGAAFDVTVEAVTVNTDNGMRDDHLKGESYFDVKNHPRIRLVSTKIATGSSGMYVFTGRLTIKDKTKEVSFPFSAIPINDTGMNFKGSFTINRHDFDIGGTSTIAGELTVSLIIIAKK